MPPASPDPFAVVSRFYDLDMEGYEDDIAMYRELVTSRGAVLELGCGTGRVAAPLAAAGLTVVGVDRSAAMLRRARERTRGLPVTLVEDDMRTLRLDRRFGSVLIPLGGLQHMERASDVAAALQTAAAHLERGGLALVDVEAAHPDDLVPGPQPLLEHWTRPWRGGTVTKQVAVEGQPSLGLRRVTWHFDEQPADGSLRRHSTSFPLRTIGAGELELAARLAGLRVREWCGDYDRSPVSDGDDRLIALLEHKP
ncbi:MAG: class I SAM-dependent methyltransferase [Dehalococcoidia bacterium]|nr:class I SAM-dependent methyltransferase [Dehalococcoidia bacterium]